MRFYRVYGQACDFADFCVRIVVEEVQLHAEREFFRQVFDGFTHGKYRCLSDLIFFWRKILVFDILLV